MTTTIRSPPSRVRGLVCLPHTPSLLEHETEGFVAHHRLPLNTIARTRGGHLTRRTQDEGASVPTTITTRLTPPPFHRLRTIRFDKEVLLCITTYPPSSVTRARYCAALLLTSLPVAHRLLLVCPFWLYSVTLLTRWCQDSEKVEKVAQASESDEALLLDYLLSTKKVLNICDLPLVPLANCQKLTVSNAPNNMLMRAEFDIFGPPCDDTFIHLHRVPLHVADALLESRSSIPFRGLSNHSLDIPIA